MTRLTVKRKIDYPPFGLWKWKDADYSVPIVIPMVGAKASFFLEKDECRGIGDLVLFSSGRIELEFDPVPKTIINGLKNRVGQTEAAHKIYSSYAEAMNKLESLLLSAANQKYMFWTRILSEDEFFGRDSIFGGVVVGWSLDGSEFKSFTPKLASPRGRNPMFKSDQVITAAKWKKIQGAANNQEFPEAELLELYRIRNKAHMRQVKTATIEASIISESLLREYGLKTLEVRGLSKNKIKKIKDELTFNNLLNVILPLSLTKSEFNRISRDVEKIDSLRRLRNDLVHGNIQEKDIDHANVVEAAEAAIRLVNLLKNKIESKS